MLAIPFDAESLTHVVWVIDPRADAARLARIYGELVRLDRTRVRGTFLSTGGALESAELLKGFEVELAQEGTGKLRTANPITRVLRLRDRIAALAPDELHLEIDGSTTAWKIAARLARVPRVVVAGPGAPPAGSLSAARPPVASATRAATRTPAPRQLARILESDGGRPSA